MFLAACGDDDGDTADTAAAEETDPTEPAESTGSDTGSDAAGDTEAAADEDVSVPTEADDEPVTDYPEKPEVEIPDEPPTELVANTLIEGEGPEAQAGDTIVVDYVGVRSSDGVEFDASYNRAAPFPITLGAGAVIDGWEQGLEGVQAGERIQLDIPSELAYGEQERSEIIGANEDLTFVIDVRSVISTGDVDPPSDADVEPSDGVEETTTEDIVVGDGDTLDQGDTGVIHFALFRGDNLQLLDSSWETDPFSLTLEPEAVALEGMYEGMLGMRVGGRRAIIIPPDEGFGPEGSPQMGLPADTDMVLVIDLLGLL
jgi:peptidylprolyl isomerase